MRTYIESELPSRRSALKFALAASTGHWVSHSDALAQVPDTVQVGAKILIDKMSQSLLGDFAPILSDPLLNLLGLGNNGDNSEEYFNAIEQQLDQVQMQLNAITEQLENLEAGLHALSVDVERIAEEITEIGLQDELKNFDTLNTRLDGWFQQYRDALSGLRATSASGRRSAVRDMFRVYDNSLDVRNDLLLMQDLFYPRTSGRIGIVEYQLQSIEQKIKLFASEPDNFRMPMLPLDQMAQKVLGQKPMPIPTADGLFAYGRVPAHAHEIARSYLQSYTMPIVRQFVGAQFKGMLLLALAWSGTRASSLQTVTQRTQVICRALGRLRQHAGQRVDASVAANLRAYGKPLKGATRDADCWWVLNYGNSVLDIDDPEYSQEAPPCSRSPLLARSEDYIMWGTLDTKESAIQNWGPSYTSGGPDPTFIAPGWSMQRLMLVQHPWQFENCRVIGVECTDKPSSDGSRMMVYASYVGKMNVPRFDPALVPELAFADKLA